MMKYVHEDDDDDDDDDDNDNDDELLNTKLILKKYDLSQRQTRLTVLRYDLGMAYDILFPALK